MTRYVRNTITGLTEALDDTHADAILAHDHLRHSHVEVETDKPEVLGQPYWIDNADKRHNLADGELFPTTFDSDEADEEPIVLDPGESDVNGVDEPAEPAPIVGGEEI